MDRIDTSRLDLAREFRADLTGPHSPDLQKLLKLLRWEDPLKQFIALQPKSDGPWYLAKMNGPKGCPLDVYVECPFATQADAAWAVFRARWQRCTGEALRLEEDSLPDPLSTQPVSSEGMSRKPLLGYADRFSVSTDETITFKVSADECQAYRAQIVRLRCGDEENLGLRQTVVPSSVAGDYPGRLQHIFAGSYVHCPELHADFSQGLFVHAYVWPTMPANVHRPGLQMLVGTWVEARQTGFVLLLEADGSLGLRIGDGEHTLAFNTGRPLYQRHWYEVAMSIDPATGISHLLQRPVHPYPCDPSQAQAQEHRVVLPGHAPAVRLAAGIADDERRDNEGRSIAFAHYNGKLEAPAIAARPLTANERDLLMRGAFAGIPVRELAAGWDFGQAMSDCRIVDRTGKGADGHTVNLPTRAMKGVRWDGSEYNYQNKPEHYGAIHFHDDDLYDCGWATDFEWQVPEDLKSGLYAAHLSCRDGKGEAEDWIPFVVSPPAGTARAPLALLLPSAAYWAYANRHTLIAFAGREHVRNGFTVGDPTGLYLHHHPELGLSTYDDHSDGSGVCYSSRLRPVVSLRPKEALWQLPADTHIIDWLEAKQIPYDVITEDDLDRHGAGLLEAYRCVMTGTHPEYPSKAMIDAYAEYQRAGGRFIYLGGNGFYWRVSFHPRLPGVMEMRRAEDGIRAWLAEGGEYYHGFTGELGGMWRRMGHPPQSVAGTGMTAQGFDRSTYYERTDASEDPRVSFIFEGVGREERIGDFGIIGGGAAGWEVDRADQALGTPPHALIVAAADNFSPGYHWMKEELTHTHAALTGDTCPLVRADMVFYETPKGGAVFSTSSIAWAGALAHNGYDNNVSRITQNVIDRFIHREPFVFKAGLT